MVTKNYLKKFKTVSAGVIGTTLEFYDYSLFGFFIPIFARVFFPHENIETSLFYSFGAFAAGFIMRPLGSLVWGYIGDSYGRHRVLTHSILLMSLSTFIICALPTYAQIGILSPLLLMACRLAQGFSAGGDYTTSFVFTLEHTQQNQKGLISSIFGTSQKLGFLLGTFAYYIVIQTANPDFNWRYAFFFGSLLGLVGLFIRRYLEESPDYKNSKRNRGMHTSPFKEAYQTSRRNIFALSGLTMCCTGIVYTTFVYLIIFFNEKFAWDLKELTRCSFYGQLICMISMLVSGYLSDKIDRKSIMQGFLFFGVIGIFPVYATLFNHTLNSPLLFYVFIGIVLGGHSGPWCALINECFPTTHKLSGISLGFSLTQAFVGGLTPLILKTMVLYTNALFVPAYYLIFCLSVGIVSLFFIRPLNTVPLQEKFLTKNNPFNAQEF